VRPGGAHTAGDLIVWLPNERVLFAGDLLIEDGVTMVVDGSAKGLAAALDTLAALAPRIAVPGHGAIPVEPQALIGRTRDYMVRLRAAMRGAIERHRSLNRALDSLPRPTRAPGVTPIARASQRESGISRGRKGNHGMEP